MEFWSSERDEQGLAEWLTGNYEAAAGDGNGEAADLAAVVGLPSGERGESPEAGAGS